jgi:hypothetical protein
MNAYVVLTSLISVTIIWIGVFWLYRDYRIDLFRQRMFSLRDEMFDRAAVGDIPFDHKSYGMLRVTMNGFIRFAHELNLAYFILTMIRHSRSGFERSPLAEKFSENMEKLPVEQRAILNKFRARMAFLVLRHILASSPLLLMTLVVPLVCWLAMRAFWEKLLELLQKPMEKMSDMAFAVGDDGSSLNQSIPTYQ